MTLIGLTLFLINRLSAIHCLFDHYFLNGAGLIFPCDNMKQPGDYIFFPFNSKWHQVLKSQSFWKGLSRKSWDVLGAQGAILMPADWKTNSTAQTRRGFVLQRLCEEEMRSFRDVFPTHRCEGGNVTLLPRCIVWTAGAEQSREALHRPSQYKLHSWPALRLCFSLPPVDNTKARSIP